jgi:putative nucleotidyltransferase with HDIG domain
MRHHHPYHVAAGSYHVGRTGPMILRAFLGTCVGVAVYDAETGVGGLIHLLLPEPVSHNGTFQPEKYASTGIPVFLRALYDAGASKGRLEAFIAGGALVGPIGDRDLQLDIGGRTAETAINHLTEAEIRIDQSETGGFFSSCLTLDMQSWQCRIEPAGIEKITVEGTLRVPTPAEIDRAVERLQPIPQVALKILRMIDANEPETKELAVEIGKDQVIGARTLRLCNSVMFAGRNKIESLEHALIFLGLKLLVKLVISSLIDDFFSRTGQGYSLCKGGLFHHAVGTAIIAETLAKVTGKANPGLAYTAGLLHDIGKVVLDQYVASAYPLFYRNLFEERNSFSESEKRILGMDHTHVGCLLAQKWSFPESLIDTIRHHHAPEKANQHHALIHIVYLADLLMSRFHSGLELERLDTATLSTRLAAVGFTLDQFPKIVDLIPTKVFESSPELALMKKDG